MKCEYCNRIFGSKKAVATHRRFHLDCASAWANDQTRIREDRLACGYVICAICGEYLKTITNTHLAKHGITMAEYKDKHGKLFAQDVLDNQRDKREKTLHTRYTDEELRKLRAKSVDTKIKKYGSLESYRTWLLSTYADEYKRVGIAGAIRFKNLRKLYYEMTEEQRRQKSYQSLEKRKKTNLKKYGVEFAQSLTFFKNKAKRTRFERYGNENYFNIEKIKRTLFEKYGKYSNFFPRFSLESQELFRRIEQRWPFFCFFATNGLKDKSNEYQVYFPGSDHVRFLDFYTPTREKWIEFDEDHHKGCISEDMKREKEVFGSMPDVSLLRISKNEYLSNADETLRDCLDYLYSGRGGRIGFYTAANINIINTRVLQRVKTRAIKSNGQQK